MIKKTAVLGFGNPCRSDDAVGVFVIEELKKKIPSAQQEVRLFDMGTSAFEILFQLKDYNKFILVDAVLNADAPVGTTFKLPAETIMKVPSDDPLVFLHSLKWDQALSYAKKILGTAFPKDIEVYLIAIENTALEIQLSDTIKKAGMAIADKILDTLRIQSQKNNEPSIYLKNNHLIIHHTLVKDLFNNESHIQCMYYNREGVLLMAPQSDTFFKSIHKANLRMLKIKNSIGDASIPIHEIIIDNELDNTDRMLQFEMNNPSKTIRLFLK